MKWPDDFVGKDKIKAVNELFLAAEQMYDFVAQFQIGVGIYQWKNETPEWVMHLAATKSWKRFASAFRSVAIEETKSEDSSN